jgi:predicted phosphohydrolase
MNVWAIADLHLSFARPDRRERYATRWRDHAARIQAEWTTVVRPDDLVLLPGDLSMARNHRDLQPDLEWLHRLPGTKILSPGNHDAWWGRVERVRPLLRSTLRAVQGDAIALGAAVVCGARGAPVCFEEDGPDRQAAAARELDALEQALEEASRLRSSARQPLYVLWHYPPFDAYGRPGPWVSRLEKAKATACLYGHLHMQGQWSRTVQGTHGGVRYYCVAADAVGFRPLRIDTIVHNDR